MNWEHTTDTFKAGDPDREVTTIAVAWKATWDALRQAHDFGAQLFVSHESICVRAVNGDPSPEVTFALPSEKPKFDWLEESGLVVYRCHDFWDRYPQEGVRWSWQQGLNLGGRVVADHYPWLITEISPRPLKDLTSHVLEKIKPLGQTGVQVFGDPNRMVSRVGTGTGVVSDLLPMMELGADVGIFTDDYFLHVRMGAHVNELGFPGIGVNHGVAEAWGIEALAGYLRRTFPEVDVIHIPQLCPYRVQTD